MSEQITRRDAIKRVAYTAPLILTIAVAPSIAASGSGGSVSGGFQNGDKHYGNDKYKAHPNYDKDHNDKDKDKNKNKNG